MPFVSLVERWKTQPQTQVAARGPARYACGGQLFESGHAYEVDEERARYLLSQRNQNDEPFFVMVADPEEIEVAKAAPEAARRGGVKIRRTAEENAGRGDLSSKDVPKPAATV